VILRDNFVKLLLGVEDLTEGNGLGEEHEENA
jgi:hypothetical protein